MDRSEATHCLWCHAELTAGESFRFELRYAAWEEGQLLLDENPAFSRHDEPEPRCDECERSLVQNYEDLLEESDEHRWMERFAVSVVGLAIVSLLGILAYTFLSGA